MNSRAGFGEEDGADYVDAVYKKVQKRMQLRGVANELYEGGDYAESRELLRKLFPLLDDPDMKLETLLKIADCDVMVDRSVRPDTDREIMQILLNPERSYYEIREMAQLRSNSAAVLLNLYTCRLMRMQAEEDKAVKEIDDCIQHATNEIKEMVEKKDMKIAASKVLPLMLEMQKELRATPCSNEALRVLTDASTLNKIGHVYNCLSKTHESLDFLLEGFRAMERHFGDGASNYHNFSSLENNISFAYAKNLEFDIAERYQLRAVADLKTAGDVPDLKKRELLEPMEKSLQNVIDMKHATRFQRRETKSQEKSSSGRQHPGEYAQSTWESSRTRPPQRHPYKESQSPSRRPREETESPFRSSDKKAERLGSYGTEHEVDPISIPPRLEADTWEREGGDTSPQKTENRPTGEESGDRNHQVDNKEKESSPPNGEQDHVKLVLKVNEGERRIDQRK